MTFFAMGASAQVSPTAGLDTNQVVTTQTEFKTVDLRPDEFIRQALKEVIQDSPGIKLSYKTPSRFQLFRFAGNSGSPVNNGFDFYMAGVLARLMGGATFSNEAQDLEKVADMNLNEIQRQAEFVKAPASHRALLMWILSQPDRSIMPHQLLAKSIEINNGDVFKALLVGWDVLQMGWRGSRSRMRREDYAKTQKLALIPHVQGDLFPSWYHLWGTMTYSFFVASRTHGLLAIPTALSATWVTIEEGLGLSKRRIESAIQRAEIAIAGAVSGEILYHDVVFMKRNPVRFAKFIERDNSSYLTGRNISLKACLLQIRTTIKSSVKTAWNMAIATLSARKNSCSEIIDNSK